MRHRTAFLLLLVLVLSTACKKYDEGPSFSLYTKGQRVMGNWYFNRVMFNERDSTKAFQKGSIEFLLYDGKGKDKGAFTWNKLYGHEFNPDHIYFGSWRLIADKDSLRMIVLNKEIADTTDWMILRLAYDEFWMQRQYDDTTVLRWELWKAIF